MELQGKKVMVVGLSRTGVALTKFLVERGAEVTVSDHKSPAELTATLEEVEKLPVKFDLGGHTPRLMLQQELIILSPGGPPELKLFDYARQNGVKVTGELEFASHFIEEPIIAVTGTNGKSSVAKYCGLMLTESGVSNWVGGSSRNPLIEYVRGGQKVQVVVVEATSFQLDLTEKFSPRTIVLTNLGETHLDRYKSFEDYVRAIRKIFVNTSANTTSVLNADDNLVVDIARDPSVQRGVIFYFSRKPALEPQIMNIGGGVLIKEDMKVRVGPEIEHYQTKNVKARGKHNLENIMAAICATRAYGTKTEAIQKVIDQFAGLPHRIEYVRKVGGVQFFNDSRAVNVHAVQRSLDTFGENLILICGGKDSNLNFRPIADQVRRKVKTLILIGEAKEKINREIGDFTETYLIGTFEEAVLIAFQKSRIGDIILMSPGCPGTDMFDSIEERGNYFKKIVNQFT
jgi:UDP-N-acetylmuramoylalanine--D-glutamate ligase